MDAMTIAEKHAKALALTKAFQNESISLGYFCRKVRELEETPLKAPEGRGPKPRCVAICTRLHCPNTYTHPAH